VRIIACSGDREWTEDILTHCSARTGLSEELVACAPGAARGTAGSLTDLLSRRRRQCTAWRRTVIGLFGIEQARFPDLGDRVADAAKLDQSSQ
jgi:hypothetical protein